MRHMSLLSALELPFFVLISKCELAASAAAERDLIATLQHLLGTANKINSLSRHTAKYSGDFTDTRAGAVAGKLPALGGVTARHVALILRRTSIPLTPLARGTTLSVGTTRESGALLEPRIHTSLLPTGALERSGPAHCHTVTPLQHSQTFWRAHLHLLSELIGARLVGEWPGLSALTDDQPSRGTRPPLQTCHYTELRVTLAIPPCLSMRGFEHSSSATTHHTETAHHELTQERAPLPPRTPFT
uniref:Uncharacterized protein n=1 Tax=Heliothis virescens TaxID=7102 RepID=A0A2A4JW10_HELVI